MRISLGLGISAIGLLALGINAPGRADGLEWLGGDAVEVAAHRMGLMGQHSDKPLMGYLARPASARQYLGHHLAYDPHVTADAWRQVRDFLQRTLREAQPAGPAERSR